MTAPTLLDPRDPTYDAGLLRLLLGRRLCRHMKTLAVIGAHRFQEVALIDRIFPALEHIYLFEPLPGPLQALREMATADARLRVFGVAIADEDGQASFRVANNDGESSSLLDFESHRDLFPGVEFERVIDVSTRRLASVLAEHALPAPDVLFIDAQGAEYRILASLGAELTAEVRLIYTEVSTERVYAGAGLLSQVQELLAPRFAQLAYAPLRPGVPMHGNAIFVAHEDIDDALALTPYGRLRAAGRVLKRWRRSLAAS